MDKDKILDDIFGDDPFDILNVKPKASGSRNPDERLLSSFNEINDFYSENGKEPQPNPTNIAEFQLYSRLKSLRENEEKMFVLEPEDKYGLLQVKQKQINDIDDIFNDDDFNLLDGDEGLFDFTHTPKDYERASADFVARRKPCKDFDKYEMLFKEVHKDLIEGKRKLVDFKEDNLRQGDFYVHNGVLMLLENINITQTEKSLPEKRLRKDGRTRCIFENGTESNMLYRSAAKILYSNGKVVTENADQVNENFINTFSNITEEDQEAGYIYVLSSKSEDEKISAIANLFKIGYSKTEVQERIKNAIKEPTYLMAPVKVITIWKCYNMNPQKLEQLLHNFFGSACLNIDIFDDNKKRYTPREWFIAPLDVIEKAIELIISGEIIRFKFDSVNQVIYAK